MSASCLIPTTEPRFRVPDSRGRFGQFGGMYVPETLMTPLLDLTKAYDEAIATPPSSRRSRTCSGIMPAARRAFVMPSR
jgi:hypothetical protein